MLKQLIRLSQLALFSLLANGPGCSSPNNEKSDAPGDGQAAEPILIRVLVVDDKPLAETVERQWKAASEGEIQIKNVSASDFTSLESEMSDNDILIYPSPWLGELVESKQLIPISSRALGEAQYDRADILPLDQTVAVTWGEKTYAFSFGVPQLVLMYRKDVFDRLGITPPATWAEYQEIVDRLSTALEGSAEPDGRQPRQATVEPLAPGWASQVLLARAAAYARNRSRYWTLFNYETMEPMIDSPPFQRALEELVAAAGGQQPAPAFDAEEVRTELLAGRALMTIGWPTMFDKAADESLEFGFAPLPGSRQVYNFSLESWATVGSDRISRVPLSGFDGRLGSVLTSAANPRDAFNFLAWLTGAKRSATICSKSPHTAPFRRSHETEVHLWLGQSSPEQAEEYFSVVSRAKNESLRLASLRIPGRDEYMAALDRAISEAIAGAEPAAALNAAADRWRGITNQLGMESQRAAYKRSLGID